MKVNILFGAEKISGRVEVKYGLLCSQETFHEVTKILLAVEKVNIELGAYPTIITILAKERSFSFLLRDVSTAYPIYIPELQAAVVPEKDERNYAEIAAALAEKGLVSDFDRMNNEPEESYENACLLNRNQNCPVWLGLGRDIRMFRVNPQQMIGVSGNRDFQYWGQITPAFHTYTRNEEPRDPHLPQVVEFVVGPGAHCRPKISRRLDDGILPILHSVQDEVDIQYHLTLFASLEKTPIDQAEINGTNWQSAYAFSGFSEMTTSEREQQQNAYKQQKKDEEVLCVVHIEAVNTSQAPAYAWFKAGVLRTELQGEKIGVVNRINGHAVPQSELAVLVKPGESVTFDILIPHSPISATRAQKLLVFDYEAHLQGARNYWQSKLAKAAQISVPEPAIDERLKAGLLHLDLVLLGEEAKGPLLPTVGWYAPIGTESAPIIQFFDAMDRADLAEKALDFFFTRQRADGFMQNYGNYQSETGPVLWTAGEHFRITKDVKWLKRVTPALIKACDYLLAWRERNKKEEYRSKGFYGLLDGKVADPNDFYHSFFLNAGTLLGFEAMTEVLQNSDPVYAEKLGKELRAYQEDLRIALTFAATHAPVAPLADGTWIAQLPPWVEYTGQICLYADGGNWFSHGAFASRSSLTGALYFALSNLYPMQSRFWDFTLKANQHPTTRENAALSQPYYSRHDIAHLRRGEVKLFLKCYYNQMSALQDRQSYTFWEHYYFASQHKTHEEGWFLMQTRWMLYYEEGDTLEIFKAVPRNWFMPGKKISICRACSHFGRLDIETEVTENSIVCHYQVERLPGRILLRLPHPKGRKPCQCSGGDYSAEVVECERKKKATIRLNFSTSDESLG